MNIDQIAAEAWNKLVDERSAQHLSMIRHNLRGSRIIKAAIEEALSLQPQGMMSGGVARMTSTESWEEIKRYYETGGIARMDAAQASEPADPCPECGRTDLPSAQASVEHAPQFAEARKLFPERAAQASDLVAPSEATLLDQLNYYKMQEHEIFKLIEELKITEAEGSMLNRVASLCDYVKSRAHLEAIIKAERKHDESTIEELEAWNVELQKKLESRAAHASISDTISSNPARPDESET